MESSYQKRMANKLKELNAKDPDNLIAKYQNAFPSNYLEETSPDVAAEDIIKIENLSKENPVNISLYCQEHAIHLRVYQYSQAIPLSDILPMLDNLDLRTLSERPYKIKLENEVIWIGDFTVTYPKNPHLDIATVKENFEEAFIRVRLGFAENDAFNHLVLAADLSWCEISILRALSRYLKQIGFRFSQPYIAAALTNNPHIARDLVTLFLNKFDPQQKVSAAENKKLEDQITQSFEDVLSLDEDKTLRTLLNLIQSSLRTNYFQRPNGQYKSYLAIKFNSRKIPELPLPKPMYEIFVYSPRFEAIHLRNTKVARGGLRWSDRREDFRTEILGLMKAQVVKNSIIVPSGAKGGFVLKELPPQATREMVQNEVVDCYKSFIRGLLDLTDNLKDHKVVHPPEVVFYDDDDSYLVVAADKGTATFSDIANGIAKEYDFWLGDAFASGGSAGYDHKEMGITARGAWESIKRHFQELNVDVMSQDFTVVGIGDMSGDVFGNGMMYTPHIKLLAAFDHRNIFLDPNPDAKKSFDERVRLFNLPTSSWEDYNPALISKGGGVFKRSFKSIKLSEEVQQVLKIATNELTPSDLIRAILQAPVDLLFNGGIGTYVKASNESQAEVGDRANEFNRVNGNELRCKVVGEGGNLGFTQLGRVEYALNGGLINTDFIDNSAGVDCSDHEVNIKILLNQEIQKNKITEAERNKLLASMTNEVAELVLQDNYSQALVMSIAYFYAPGLISLHQGYIHELELTAHLNRKVEFLPDDKTLLERKAAGIGLTRPELAVLLAYTKIRLKAEIINSNLPEHPYLSRIVEKAFPKSLREKYAADMQKHTLRRDIIATQLSNFIVDEMGITFVYNLQTETGSTVPEILSAAIVATRVFESFELRKLIDSFSFKISLSTQYELIGHIRRLIYLATRWFIRNKAITENNIKQIIDEYSKGVKVLENVVPYLMGGTTKNYLQTLSSEFEKVGIDKDAARRIAGARAMYTALNIILIANRHHYDLIKTAKMYFPIGEFFNLLWFRDRIASDTREGYWETLSRLTLRDELDIIQKHLTIAIMKSTDPDIEDPNTAIKEWMAYNHKSIERWERILKILHSSTSTDYAMFFIALRELTDIIHASELERREKISEH